MTEFHQAARDLAAICREAISRKVFGCDAPNDSNALSEVWPTAQGAAFTGEHHGQRFLVAVVPEDPRPLPGSLGYPSYTASTQERQE